MNFAHTSRTLLAVLCLAAAPAFCQDKPSAQPVDQAAEAPPAADQPAFKPEELEQMLAPLALYPDSLLSQVFMASTYPIEVVEADRWVKAHPELKGDALAKELEKQTWDPSVRSLVNFPQVLAMMSENLSTTVKIGDAFIGQQEDVMKTVQKLRAKAKSTGNLKSTEQQKVTTESSGGTEVIIIESSSPEVVYVPQYNPTVVYGTWPYPTYPPYPYYPPGYVASNIVSFGVGVAVGAAWGYAWGNCNWGGNDIDIDIDRNTNINNNIDRSKYKNQQKGVSQNGRGSFKHDPSHRQGAAYRNQSSAQRVGASNTAGRTSQARSEYRGKAEAGRTDINRGGADAFKGASPSTRNTSAANRSGTAGPSTTGTKSGAFSDANRGGSATREASSRGASSRSASPSSSRSSASRSSPSRSSGGSRGGSRGGGGRR